MQIYHLYPELIFLDESRPRSHASGGGLHAIECLNRRVRVEDARGSESDLRRV